ncbi:MAG: tRNA epoxyqueuosine(34) reductase QueG [Weeksellaceae bacterium]|nr:tRNA epoxyqueuosine(34) reductase QueG [Weeksellaceae bacterium]
MIKSSPENITARVKSLAQSLGFLDCRVAKADYLPSEATRLEKWLNQGFHGQMAYMENHFDKRLDPRKLVPGAKSVISLSYNYYPKQQQRTDTYQIAKYAYGEDYHFVIKDLLKELVLKLSEEIGEFEARVFTDSAPVLEKAWAVKSGIGWQGKNANVLTQKTGSFYFLGEIISELELVPDQPVTDHCGTCTACIDACPTQAIVQPSVVDGSKCISYATIELKDAIPSHISRHLNDWIFGCDICQDVCPWNRFSKPHSQQRFEPKAELLEMHKQDWQEITQELFSHIFRKSAVKRTKYTGLIRNIEATRDKDE